MTPAKTTLVCAEHPDPEWVKETALTSNYAGAISHMNHAQDWHGTSDAVYMAYVK
jgi:hypothetical protein